MGDLPLKQAEHLFPQNFRHHLPLRLVGGHVLREQLGAFGQVADEGVHQLGHPIPLLGGDGQDGVKVELLLIGVDNLQQLVLLFQRVNLVDNQHPRHLQRLHPLHQLQFRCAGLGDGLYHQYGGVHIGDAGSYHPVHVLPQPVPCLVKPRRVGEHELTIPPGDDAADAVAGGLGLVGDDGDLLPYQCVEQGGFAHVGAANDGDDS